MKIRIAIIAACAATFALAQTDLAQAAVNNTGTRSNTAHFKTLKAGKIHGQAKHPRHTVNYNSSKSNSGCPPECGKPSK